MDFTSVLKQIPPTVWGTAIGSTVGALLALPGLALSLRHARKLQVRQLAHDTEERIRERQMSWRREVYLEAAESISRLSGLLGRVADLNVPDQELSSVYQADYARVSRIQIIAATKTVAVVNKFLGEFACHYLQLSVARGLLLTQRNEIQSLTAARQYSAEAMERSAVRLAHLDSNQNGDPILRAAIAAEVEAHRNKADSCEKLQSELSDQLPKAQVELFKAAMEAGYQLTPLLIPALVFAREELGIPLDVEQYTRNSDEVMQRIKSTVNASLERVDQMLNNQKAAAKEE
jgi:hypothetical protein